MAESFLDLEAGGIVNAICNEIALQLFDEWNDSNLNEGVFYADYQIAEMSNNNYIKGRFNQFYDLKPGDEDYLEWDENE